MVLHRWWLGPSGWLHTRAVRCDYLSYSKGLQASRQAVGFTDVDASHKRLAKNIRARAKELDLPLSHIPDRAGINRAHFWTVLNGTSSPTLKWIVKVADTLDCDAADLLAKR